VVDDEESGLVNILGIHSSIFEVDVPYVADLWVYLRWEAKGAHRRHGVVNVDGDVVADLSEDVTFEDYATNFTTHSLANTVFEDEGTYVVVVRVDGEELLDLPFCVNDDSDVSKPVPPHVAAAVDAGPTRQAGARWKGHSSTTPSSVSPADDFAIVTFWFSGDDSYEQRVEITDPTGTW